jgi:hypothetical protein
MEHSHSWESRSNSANWDIAYVHVTSPVIRRCSHDSLPDDLIQRPDEPSLRSDTLFLQDSYSNFFPIGTYFCWIIPDNRIFWLRFHVIGSSFLVRHTSAFICNPFIFPQSLPMNAENRMFWVKWKHFVLKLLDSSRNAILVRDHFFVS